MERERFRLTEEPIGLCRWCDDAAHAYAVIRAAGTKGGRHRPAQKEPVCSPHAERLWFQGAEIVSA